MKTKRFFSAESEHGSSTSFGFANDTVVFAFSSKKARDTYVDNSKNLSCEKIRFDQVTRRATNRSLTSGRTNAPKPFSGEFWGIMDARDLYEDKTKLFGFVGVVERCRPEYDNDQCRLVEKLHRKNKPVTDLRFQYR